MLITKRVCDMCGEAVDGERAIVSFSAEEADLDLCPSCGKRVRLFIATGSQRSANADFGKAGTPVAEAPAKGRKEDSEASEGHSEGAAKPHGREIPGKPRPGYARRRGEYNFDREQPNFYSKWTPADKAKVWNCRITGGDYKALAKELGRSLDSVVTMSNRLANNSKGKEGHE